MKLVFAPFGADMFGEDVLLFEHALFFAMEMAVDAADGWVYADVHQQTGGADKREQPVPPFTEQEIRALAEKAQCDALIDGLLQVERNPETAGLTQITVAPRVYFPAERRFAAPDAFTFVAFDPEAEPEKLALEYDHLLELQYAVCEALFETLGRPLPAGFSLTALRITDSWRAYELFLKGKRLSNIPETKLGYYEQALQKDPKMFWAIYNAGMLYKSQTDYQTARSRLMKAAAATDDPRQLGDTYFELGVCSIHLGDTKTARNFWEKAQEYMPDNPTLYVNLAGTYEQEEDWGEAARLCEKALEIYPDYHKALVTLGRLHAMFGRMDQAIEMYERALELEPDDALRRSVLGGCYLAVERTEDARAQFERAVELDPDSDPGRYARQELDKLGPKDDGGPKKKKWGIW
jgi:tetratricopeptide (TPR) repeat protein